MISELVKAFFLVFIAEMGDKTQIIAMTFATKYKIREVLLGVVLGVVLNHGLAIILGRFILNFISLDKIQLLAAFIFIIFAYLSLREDEEEEEEASSRSYGPIITVAMAFFLGELGDKTQLTAMTLATDASYPLFILAGTTLGMVGTSLLGIIVGSKIGGKIPDLYIKIVSSIVFLIFGLTKLYGLIGFNIGIIFALILEVILIIRLTRVRQQIIYSPIQIAAENLYKETQIIKSAVDDICLGEATCGHCDGKNCLLGYIRSILNESLENKNYSIRDTELLKELKMKEFDKDKVINALATIIYTAKKNHWNMDEDFVVTKVADYLEEYLLGQMVNQKLTSEEYLEGFRRLNNQYGIRLKRILKGLERTYK